MVQGKAIHDFCGVDVFLLGPRLNPAAPGIDGTVDTGKDQRWRVALYGDTESVEHAKTRVLIYIDKLVSSFTSEVGYDVLTDKTAWSTM